MKVTNLEGALLDLWVARAEGKCYTQNPGEWGLACINDLGRLSIAKVSWDCARYFEPSKNWAHGGPIIDRERISINERDGDCWQAHKTCGWSKFGPTPLVAAMRAYVASKFGEELPDEAGFKAARGMGSA